MLSNRKHKGGFLGRMVSGRSAYIIGLTLVIPLGFLSSANAENDGGKKININSATVKQVDAHIEEAIASWVEFYKSCHASPELSLHEEKSSQRIAKRFKELGLKTTSNIGGFGVVGVLENGPGPSVLIRGDMDALPIVEETQLPFASKVTFTREDGTQVGVMHACGHDVHQTVLVATAQMLAELRQHWSGTVVFLAQPAEEIGRGARAMIEDGLFEKVPKPDYCLALHVSGELKVGTVGYTSGWGCANVDSVDITIYGKGGHGAHPDQTVDPIVTGAQLVMALQTIVSRKVDPRDPAVVTVGSFHAGTKHNIIPSEAQLKLTVRSFTDEVRKQVLDSIRQIAIKTCESAGCPKPPTVQVLEKDFTPALYNDPDLTASAVDVFKELLGAEAVIVRRPTTGGEDFGQFPRTQKVPGFMYWLGVVEEGRFAASEKPGGPPLPGIHSSTFQVEPEPTIRAGVRSMATLAMAILEKSSPK